MVNEIVWQPAFDAIDWSYDFQGGLIVWVS